MYACVYAAGYDDQRRAAELAEHSFEKDVCELRGSALIVVAQQFSPRYESRGDLIVIDASGLDRLFGSPKAIGEEMRRDAADRGLRAHVAVAATQTAAMMLAISRPGVVVVERGEEAAAIARVPLDVFRRAALSGPRPGDDTLQMFSRWGLRTAGDLAALPADQLSARLGRQGLVWHALANGRDVRPLVPDVEDERLWDPLESTCRHASLSIL